MNPWEDDLREDLKDPEFAAHFANAQQESLKELLKCGVVKSGNLTSLSNRTKRLNWEVKEDAQ